METAGANRRFLHFSEDNGVVNRHLTIAPPKKGSAVTSFSFWLRTVPCLGLTPILEVKSGRGDKVSGMTAFRKRYPKAKVWLVGATEIKLEECFSRPASEWFQRGAVPFMKGSCYSRLCWGATVRNRK